MCDAGLAAGHGPAGRGRRAPRWRIRRRTRSAVHFPPPARRPRTATTGGSGAAPARSPPPPQPPCGVSADRSSPQALSLRVRGRRGGASPVRALPRRPAAPGTAARSSLPLPAPLRCRPAWRTVPTPPRPRPARRSLGDICGAGGGKWGGAGREPRQRSPGASRRDAGGGTVPHHARRALLSQQPSSPVRVLGCAHSTRGRRPGRGPPAAGMPGMTLKIRRGAAFAARQPLGGAVGAPIYRSDRRECSPSSNNETVRHPDIRFSVPPTCPTRRVTRVPPHPRSSMQCNLSAEAFLNAVQYKC